MAEGTFVKGIAEKTKAEDGEGKSVAGSERIAVEEAGKGLIVVLLAGNDAKSIHQLCSIICELSKEEDSNPANPLPKGGVERYGQGRNYVAVS